MPKNRIDISHPDGAVTRVRRYGRRGATRLLLSHGNGFAIDGYAAFWRPLARDFELLVFDQRNHGLNPPSDESRHNFANLAADLDRIVRWVNQTSEPAVTVGLFHSLSARVALLHAKKFGWSWDALVLVDPPMVPPQGRSRDESIRYDKRLLKWAEQRQQQFSSSDQLASYWAGTRAHANWQPEAYQDMAKAVLRPHDNSDGHVLRCPSHLEARIYAENSSLDLWPLGDTLPGPVMLLGSDPDVEHSAPSAASNREYVTALGCDYHPLTGAGHMLQLEKPEAARCAVIDFIGRAGANR